jgi:small-conductance mechanosensitive channel
MIRSSIDHLLGRLAFLADWTISAAIMVGAAAVAWLCHAAILAMIRRLVGQRRNFLRSVAAATRGPARLAMLLIALALALPEAPLGSDGKAMMVRLLGLATICLMGWVATTVLHIAADIYLKRFRIDVDDNILARKHITQVRVLMRVADAVIVLVTAGLALMTFDAVRQFGVTIFASAGVAGIVAGLAARPVLTNFLAGVQIAVAQPIRIDDAIIVENEFGNVEEINFSYVVIRLWDMRRMVVPLSYFIEKPFQNWTRVSGGLIGTVVLYVDHSAPVDAIRDKLAEIVKLSPLWNGKTASLQVTDCREFSITLQANVSANNPGSLGDLRCEVREKLINFLQREHPSALPRRRYQIDDLSQHGHQTPITLERR